MEKFIKILKIYSIVVLSLVILSSLYGIILSIIPLVIDLRLVFLSLHILLPYVLLMLIYIPYLIAIVTKEHYGFKNVVYTIALVLTIFSLISYVSDGFKGYDILKPILGIIFFDLPPLVYLYLFLHKGEKHVNNKLAKLNKDLAKIDKMLAAKKLIPEEKTWLESKKKELEEKIQKVSVDLNKE